MNQLKLNDNHALALEFYGKKIRLVVYKDGVEKVCRKETLKNLKNFLQSDEGHLFKGRLQLNKNSTDTNVMVKGELVGTFDNSHWSLRHW